MAPRSRSVICTLILLLGTAAQARAQQPETQLIVAVTCECDRVALQKAVPFATIVSEPAGADVRVVITTQGTQSSLVASGLGRFAGRDRTITFEVAPSTTPEAAAADVARIVMLALAEYAADTSAGSRLDVAFRKPAAASQTQPLQQDQKDPWNYWVFRLNANTNMYGEQSASERYYAYSASANRTTEDWKLRLSAYRNVSKSSFDVDETTTITSRLSDWSVESIAVKSLGPRWSLGVTSSLVGSTYSNARRIARVDPGIEFDWFPYKESSRRSLTFI